MAKSRWEEIKEKLPLIGKWARDGLTEEQICKNLGISCSTLYDYKKIYPEIVNTLKKSREVLITEVENALIKKALGFQFEEVETYIQETGGVKTQRVKKVLRYSPPDTGAIAFILKNRDKENWNDNPKMYELRKELLELQKQAQEMDKW